MGFEGNGAAVSLNMRRDGEGYRVYRYGLAWKTAISEVFKRFQAVFSLSSLLSPTTAPFQLAISLPSPLSLLISPPIYLNFA